MHHKKMLGISHYRDLVLSLQLKGSSFLLQQEIFMQFSVVQFLAINTHKLPLLTCKSDLENLRIIPSEFSNCSAIHASRQPGRENPVPTG